ncbi:MAG: hemolysin family protein, partial [Acidimicrobiia bacterium]
MEGSLPQLALVAALVIINAAFAGSEIALISLREGQLHRLDKRSATGRLLARLARDPNRFLATIQIGITLAGFLASATAAVALAEPLVEPLAFLGGFAEPAAVVLVTLALTLVTLVLGELAPKRVAMQRAEGWGLLVARPLSAMAAAARPVIWLLGRATDLTVRLMGGDPSLHREDVTQEELRSLVASQVNFTPEQHAIISGAFEIGDRTLRQILVPRREVLSLPGELPAGEGLRRLVESGHSRAPVVNDDLDDVYGVVHLRDLLLDGGRVADHAGPALAVPESLGVIDALRLLQAEHQQLAVVVNEHGGADGIVTIED